VEFDRQRGERIRDNLMRLRLDARIVIGDAGAPQAWWDGQPYDRILIDAPCSATGVLRRRPDVRLHRRASDLPALHAQQARIVHALWPLLATGGRMVYATCSLLREENEAQIEAFLAAHADFRQVPISEVWKDVLGCDAPTSVIPAEEPGPMRHDRGTEISHGSRVSAAEPVLGPREPRTRGRLARDDSGSGITGTTLALTPAQHGTDGFFAAVLERVKVPK
jgi:16S rRNA C967 or C1407 C5-methylase (RsmB/RsmF family)